NTSGKPVSDTLRRDLLSYYADLEKPFATKRNSKDWHKLIKELDTLKSTPAVGMSLPIESPHLSAFFIQEFRRSQLRDQGVEIEECPRFLDLLVIQEVTGARKGSNGFSPTIRHNPIDGLLAKNQDRKSTRLNSSHT